MNNDEWEYLSVTTCVIGFFLLVGFIFSQARSCCLEQEKIHLEHKRMLYEKGLTPSAEIEKLGETKNE